MRRRSPAGNILLGAMVGGAVARRSADRRDHAADQRELQQAQLAQAQAEANYANAQAMALQQQQQQQQQPQVVYAAPVAPPPQPKQQQQHADMGRTMLNQALSDTSGAAAQDLLYLQKQLKVTQLLCEQAMGMYQQSLQLNQAAQRTNVVGNVMGNASRGNTVGLVMDQSRNAKMRASTQPAEQASKMLVDGFARLPDALRLRYPQEMGRVGNVPAARLKVGSFGRDVLMGAAFGQTGSNVNDVMMAKRIKDNEREIRECIQVVREQLQLMQIVQARLEQDIAHAQRNGGGGAAVATAVPVARAAAPPPPPPAAMAMPPPPQEQQLQLRAAHVVDEVAMAPYGIISVPQGAVVQLVQGSLQTGLGGNYGDYIEVRYQGKVGKISRLIVQPV